MKVWEGNQSLDSYLPEDYYDLNCTPNEAKYQFFSFGYIGAQSDLTQVMTLKKKNLKLSLWAQPDVNCEQGQAVLRNRVCN